MSTKKSKQRATAPKAAPSSAPAAVIAANKKAQAKAVFVTHVSARRAEHEHAHGPRGPPRLMSKAEVLAITGVTFPTIWSWMRNGTFPRSRVVGGKSMWRSDEVDAWLGALPIRKLKGDPLDTRDWRNGATVHAKGGG